MALFVSDGPSRVNSDPVGSWMRSRVQHGCRFSQAFHILASALELVLSTQEVPPNLRGFPSLRWGMPVCSIPLQSLGPDLVERYTSGVQDRLVTKKAVGDVLDMMNLRVWLVVGSLWTR